MSKSIVWCFLLLNLAFFYNPLLGQRKATTNSDKLSASPAKLEVEKFGLAVIKSYFDGDCDFTYQSLAERIRSKESGQVFEKNAQLKAMLCAESPLRTDIQVSFEMYKANYNQKVYTAQEFATQFPQLRDAFALNEGEFFFMGNEPKAAGSTRVFRASDMAAFVVRKENGQWRIIAI